MRFRRAAVHSHQPLHQGESHPEPPLGPVERSVRLCEQVEDDGERLGSDALAIVLDGNEARFLCPRDLQSDLPALGSVLCRVVEG